MKILQHGKNFDTNKPFNGTCAYCNCIVEFERKEIKRRYKNCIGVNCPECHEFIQLHDHNDPREFISKELEEVFTKNDLLISSYWER